VAAGAAQILTFNVRNLRQHAGEFPVYAQRNGAERLCYRIDHRALSSIDLLS